MLYREVPKNGDKLSILGFGTMRMPAKGMGIDEELAKTQIHKAIDEGVNYIDTAVPYNNGKGEEIVGRILADGGYRNKVKIATKLPHWSAKSKEDMHKLLEKQLTDLQTDYIDYYLIHNLTGHSWEEAMKNGVIEFLNEALESRKIINAGFSYHGSPTDFNKIVDDFEWTYCQIQYNFLDTNNQAGRAGLKYAASKNMAVMIMEPLRGGNLAKKPPREIQHIWNKNQIKRTPVEWSLRWIWNHPEVTVVLSGMNTEEHIQENIRIASEANINSLTNEELSLVSQAAKKYKEMMPVNCTSCQYCMPCPVGVSIPSVFEAYNTEKLFKDPGAKMMYWMNHGGISSIKIGLADQCINCGVCAKKCPQHIPIPEKLKEARKTVEPFYMKPALWLMKKMMGVRR